MKEGIKMTIFLFSAGLFLIVLSFFVAETRPVTVRQWFDRDGIHFTWDKSSINFTWDQIEASKNEHKPVEIE